MIGIEVSVTMKRPAMRTDDPDAAKLAIARCHQDFAFMPRRHAMMMLWFIDHDDPIGIAIGHGQAARGT